MVGFLNNIHMMHHKAYLAACERPLRPLPTRATRALMNGSHTIFFNPRAAERLPVSHKVCALLDNE
jgi:hypothetical protein